MIYWHYIKEQDWIFDLYHLLLLQSNIFLTSTPANECTTAADISWSAYCHLSAYHTPDNSEDKSWSGAPVEEDSVCVCVCGTTLEQGQKNTSP